MSSLFPELDGVFAGAKPTPEAPAPEADAQPESSSAAPVRAGVESLKSFARAMQLEGALLEVSRFSDGHVEFVAALPGGPRERFSLVPPSPRAWLRAPGFAIQYRGEPLSRGLSARLNRFGARYRRATLAQLASRVLPDEGDRFTLRWDDPKSLFYSYASAKAWRTFFEDKELYRGVCETFSGNVAYVSHEELECNFNTVHSGASTVTFFNTVETDLEPRASWGRRHFLSTDLQDLDVIKGGDAKLDQALESIAAFPEKPSMVLIGATCVPLVTGDDIEASAARARSKLKLPVLYLGNENNPQEELLQRMLNDVDTNATRRVPGRVNLLGFPELPGREQLTSLLEACGVELGCELYPSFDPAQLREFPRAELLILYPWERYHEPITRLLQRFPDIPTLRPPPPFGLRASETWLRAVTDALGRTAAFDSIWRERQDEWEPAWEALRAQARGYRVGFVCDDSDWRAALSATRRMGVPLLSLVSEFGFAGVDVFVYTGLRPPAPAPEPWITLRGYATPQELEAELRRSRAVAIYSELYFDKRLSRTGKNIFSLRDVSCGPRGAVDTLTRLLARCRLPFYRRYQAHLGEPFPAAEAP